MKELTKGLAVFINLANYGVGIAVVLILIFRLDFKSIFYVNGMSTNESLFFNMILFEAGLTLVGIIISILARDYKKLTLVVEYPIIYEAVPLLVSVISIIYALRADTEREKIFVIAAAVIYALLSLVVIYSGTNIFQIFPSKKNSK